MVNGELSVHENLIEVAGIIQLAQRGDELAFATLVHRFQDMAVGYAFAHLGDFHLAEDAAQEAFLQIHRDLAQLREPQAFPSWFRTVLYKQCDRITRGKKLSLIPLDAGIATADPTTPAALLEQDELCQRVHRALAALTDNHRQVVTLYYIADYSQKEIAAFLTLPLTTVKKRLYDAKQQLKASMIDMAQDYLQGHRPSRDEQFQTRVLDIVAPNRQQDEEAIYALFEHHDQPAAFQWRAGRLAHSHVDWATSRIAVLRPAGQEKSQSTDEAEVIAAMHVYNIAMRVGTARIRTAGFNCEVTDPAHGAERSALLDRMVTSSLAAMRDAGYDLALSFDDEAFWLAKGFALGWRALQWHVAVVDLPTAATLIPLYRFEPNHHEDMATLYNKTHEPLTGTAERPTYRRNKHPAMFMGWYWTDAQGNPAGYISGGGDRHFTLDETLQEQLDRGVISEQMRHQFAGGSQWENEPLSAEARCTVQQHGNQWLIEDGERKCFIHREGDQLQAILFDRPLFWVDEVAGEPAVVLQALGQLARQWDCTEVFFDRLHYKSAVGKRLRQMASCRIHTGTYSRSPRSYVVRIVNLESLLKKLAAELTRRLQASPYATWQGNLCIVLEENGATERVLLAFDKGVVSLAPVGETAHVIRGGQALAQLIVGSEAAEEVVEMAGIEVSGDARQLLSVLFPAQWPQMGNQGL